MHQTFLSSPRTLESIWRGAKIWCNNSTKCRCYSWTTNRKPCHSEVIIEFLDLKNPPVHILPGFYRPGEGWGKGAAPAAICSQNGQVAGRDPFSAQTETNSANLIPYLDSLTSKPPVHIFPEFNSTRERQGKGAAHWGGVSMEGREAAAAAER